MIFVACALTVIIEVPFLAMFGFRSREDVAVTVCTNVVTNLLLNLIIQLAFRGTPRGWIYPMELAVVLAEYFIYAEAFEKSWKMLGLTAAANCISYGIGLLFF